MVAYGLIDISSLLCWLDLSLFTGLQGLSLDRAVKGKNSYAHGMAYVALSRVKSLEGVLVSPDLRYRRMTELCMQSINV